MCTGGQLVADFEAGTDERPDVPDVVGEHLTTTADGTWVVWAHKLALPRGDAFLPLAGGGVVYGTDAVAQCSLGRRHRAPHRDCTCGFHALSEPWPSRPRPQTVALEVVLSGRVLAFEWGLGGLLFRAARQTVVRLDTTAAAELDALLFHRKPDDPDGRLAATTKGQPRGAGPQRLALPRAVAVDEHVSYCPDALSVGRRRSQPPRRRIPVLTSAG